MKIKLLILLLFMSTNCNAEEKYEFWVWATKDALLSPLTVDVVQHHACGGKIAMLRTNKMPIKSPYFSPEDVYEYTAEGKKLRSWKMPVDYVVYAIEGDSIITGHGNLEKLLKVSTSGKLNHHTQLEYKNKLTDCPRKSFGDSVYERCFKYKDLQTGKERILSYQGPCT